MALKKKNSAEIIRFAEADQRLKGALSKCFMGEYETALFFASNLVLPGDFLPSLKKLAPKAKYDVVVVAGSLTVKGRLVIEDQHPGLFVKGKTHAETIEGGDCEMHLHGGSATYFVYGYYNHGSLYAGTVKTPWLIESDHDFEISVGKARTVDNFGRGDSYDFNRENIGTSFVAGVLAKDKASLDVNAFLKFLRSKKPVLVKGAKTIKALRAAEVKATAHSHETTLDLTDKKVTAFPKHVLKMPWLQTLVLDRNRVGSVPKEIDRLVNLQTLSLLHCEVGALPESLGSLPELRELRISGTFTLPRSMGSLAKLETIVLSHACGEVVQADGWARFMPWQIPESLGAAKKLKRVIGTYASLEGPESFRGKTSIEEVVLCGGDARYLRDFPEWVTELPNLKRLDLSDNYFSTIPPSFAKLTNLEELDLRRSLACLDRLPDFSKHPKLRSLNLSGGCSHTRFRRPPHERLRPLFSMKLEALETLHIDRWGKEDGYREELTAAELTGIGRFTRLSWLDLSFNGLTDLPAEFFELRELKWLNLQYNAFSPQVLARIAAAFPTTVIDFRDMKNGAQRPKKTQAAELASSALYSFFMARHDEALSQADQALKTAEREASVLVAAHDVRRAVHESQTEDPKRSGAQRAASKSAALAEAELVLSLAPGALEIIHLTPDNFPLRTAACNAAHLIAKATADDASASSQDLTRAKVLIDQAAKCVDSTNAKAVRATQARLSSRQ